MAGIGATGHARLTRAHAVVVGVGALGCLSAELLARAGVGRLTLLDRDLVEWSNLSRQTLFTEADAEVGAPKAEAARLRLAEINREIEIVAHTQDVHARTAEAAMGFGGDRPPSVILDGVDTFETRYLLNDLAIKHGVPLVHGGAVGSGGSVLTIVPGVTPCLRCLEPDPPAPGSTPTCESAGILGPAAAVVASMQAGEAIRVLLGLEAPPTLAAFDLLAGRWTRTASESARDPACPRCVGHRFEFLDADPDDAASLCSSGAVQITPRTAHNIELKPLADRLAPHGAFTLTPFYVRGSLHEAGVGLTVFADGRALLTGAGNIERARSVYARYVGG